MRTTLTVDKAGRVVLPKTVRDKLQLSAGDALALESSGDQIVLRPVRGAAKLRKKRGIWVLDVGEPVSAQAIQNIVDRTRREREDSWISPNLRAEGARSHPKRTKRK